VDSIVTDPPYELGFMGKSWDASGIAYNVEVWRECLRVLKPGGHLLAFGGSRTYHRLACAVEDAGFEIRDQIMWVYGSGFPKSLDVGKAIDKMHGAERDTLTEEVSDIFGNRTERLERPAFGIGANGSAFNGHAEGAMARETAPATDDAKKWDGWGTALKPAHEPVVVARKPLAGTVAQNVLRYGTGAINIDGCRVEGKLEGDPNRFAKTDGGSFNAFSQSAPVVRSDGRWPANFIHDGSDEVLELFPETKPETSAARFFYCAKASKAERNAGLEHLPKQSAGIGDTRPSGDFNQRLGTNDKPAQPVANHHPTVKPIDLMRYLIRLVTPPNGTVLDPFAGSGTTLVAAIHEHMNPIGIELTEEYWPIIEARTDHARNKT
jgi:site-specific DNA-methyltransferase (adenine-specific)